jgi:hypothetical protein
MLPSGLALVLRMPEALPLHLLDRTVQHQQGPDINRCPEVACGATADLLAYLEVATCES